MPAPQQPLNLWQLLPPLAMRWERVCFLHWPLDPSALAASLPAGLRPDLHGGKAYLGVVALQIGGLLPVLGRGQAGLSFSEPLFSGFPLSGLTFPELNLRTYVQGPQGAGVWFYSLDAGHALAAQLARAATGLHYRPAQMSMHGASKGESEGEHTSFFSSHPDFAFGATYRGSGAVYRAEQGSLEHFLTERYRLYSLRGGQLLTARVAHEPWPLQRARVQMALSLSGPLGWALRGEAHALYSHGVAVRSGRFSPA